jgi:hypothetical protein
MELTDFERIFRRFWNAIGRTTDHKFNELLNEHYQFVKDFDENIVESAYMSYSSTAQDNTIPPIGRLLTIVKDMSATDSHEESFHTIASRFALVCCEDLCQNPRHKRYRSHFTSGVTSKELYHLLYRNMGNRHLTDEELKEFNKLRSENGCTVPIRPSTFEE